MPDSAPSPDAGAPQPAATVPPRVRHYGPVNWRGVWTLYRREVTRFLKVATQTVLAPVVTTLLFYAIFTIALGGSLRMAGDVPFAIFLAPGLIMMAIIQNSFANTSASMMTSKIQGSIVDLLMPPMSPAELAAGFVAGGITRGVLVGLVVGTAVTMFVALPLHNVFFVAYHAVAASMMLALLGLIGGIWAEKFDHMAAITNFVITPLAFLSGTFYSIDRLPELWQGVARANPFFYMIDGFRYGFIGRADTSPWQGLLVMAAVDVALFTFVYVLLLRGYKLKS